MSINESFLNGNRVILRTIKFPVEFDPTPSHDNQLFLPSGIKVNGVEIWLERLTKANEVIERLRNQSTSPVREPQAPTIPSNSSHRCNNMQLVPHDIKEKM